jgi:glutathione S-transferase
MPANPKGIAMPAILAIGARSYSSWSLRPWLVFEHLGLPVETRMIHHFTPGFFDELADFAPARTVPAIRWPDGTVACESLAIIEEIATRHPDAAVWPKNPADRALARTLAAEMHAGFTALRNHCPHNLRSAYRGFVPPPEVLADLKRLEDLWALARSRRSTQGPWLFGTWSAADAFYAPVAMRIAGYDLPVGPETQAYVTHQLADPALRRWRAQGLATEGPFDRYDLDLPHRPWPGPAPLPARAVAEGPSENATCPYSGKPVSYYLEFDGRTFGFCNATCRDKTVLDPGAFPRFMAIAARATA